MTSFLEKLKKDMNVEDQVQQENMVREPETELEKMVKPVQKKKAAKKSEIKTPSAERSSLQSWAEKLEVKELKAEESPLAKPLDVNKKWFVKEGQLAVDFYETPEDLVIQSAVAGVKPEDLDISIEADRVLIKGERQEQAEQEGPSFAEVSAGKKNYFYQECFWGRFSRELILPQEIDPSRAQATMKNGVLTIRVPKINREKKRKLEVKG